MTHPGNIENLKDLSNTYKLPVMDLSLLKEFEKYINQIDLSTNDIQIIKICMEFVFRLFSQYCRPGLCHVLNGNLLDHLLSLNNEIKSIGYTIYSVKNSTDNHSWVEIIPALEKNNYPNCKRLVVDFCGYGDPSDLGEYKPYFGLVNSSGKFYGVYNKPTRVFVPPDYNVLSALFFTN